VIFMEHRLLCNMQSYVPLENSASEIGKGRVMHSGNDITLVGISHMVIEALRASHYLEKAGIGAEVIDPIWLKPLDIDLIVESVRKTGRLLVVDNGWLNCGASGEIILQVLERLPEGVRGKPIAIKRLGFAESPCPTTKPLENLFYSNGKTIAEAALKLIDPTRKIELPADHEIKEVDEFKGPF
jgi:acetoin:2,6-dichlorophenolindophenol oxidoreductase subunit beta